MIEFDFGSNGGRLQFENIDELSGWIERQRAAWEWVQLAKENVHALRGLWNTINGRFNSLRDNVSHAMTTSETAKITNDINNTFGSSSRFPVAETRLGKYLIRLKDEDPISAAYALWSVLGTNEDGTGLKVLAVRGAFLAMFHEFGISGDLVPHQLAFDALLEKSQARRVELENDHRLAIESAIASNDSIQSNQVDQAKTFDEFIKASREEFAALDRFYREKMKLKASVEYWEDKAKRHKGQLNWLYPLVPICGFASVAAVVVCACVLAKRLNDENLILDRSGIIPDWLHSPYFAALLAVAIGAFWGIRILVRLLFSHIHLQEDALERVTLAKTYQAMLSEQADVSEEERKIVITQLFRHAATGVVKDDAAPAHPIEIITRPNN
jgi:hypothetical protein